MIFKVLNPSFIFRISKETHIYLLKLEIFLLKKLRNLKPLNRIDVIGQDV